MGFPRGKSVVLCRTSGKAAGVAYRPCSLLSHTIICGGIWLLVLLPSIACVSLSSALGLGVLLRAALQGEIPS